jgi:putative AIP processing-secretion protein
MEKCSKKIINYMLNNNIILEQDKEIYLFGLISMLRILLNIITLISIGILFGMVGECIVFVIFIILLRTYSGGFHSDNPTICYFISVITVILALLSIKFEVLNMYGSIVLLVASLVASLALILKYAPVEHKNKPLEEIEIKVYRRRLLVVMAGLLFISILLIFLNFKSLLIAGNMAFLVDAFMILLSKKKGGLRDEM